jgi:hypothetical protein
MPVVRKCVYCGKSMIRSTYEMAIHVEQCRKKIETVQKTKQNKTYSKNVHSNTLCKR